jgi:hypothetical protein
MHNRLSRSEAGFKNLDFYHAPRKLMLLISAPPCRWQMDRRRIMGDYSQNVTSFGTLVSFLFNRELIIFPTPGDTIKIKRRKWI